MKKEIKIAEYLYFILKYYLHVMQNGKCLTTFIRGPHLNRSKLKLNDRNSVNVLNHMVTSGRLIEGLATTTMPIITRDYTVG